MRRYRIIAGFAEHDERFGSRAEVEVQLEAAPAREEAARPRWPAVSEETTRALGEGDWRPSLNWIDVFQSCSTISPQADPAAGLRHRHPADGAQQRT